MQSQLTGAYAQYYQQVHEYLDNTFFVADSATALTELHKRLQALMRDGADPAVNLGTAESVARQIRAEHRLASGPRWFYTFASIYGVFLVLLLLTSLDGTKLYPLLNLVATTVLISAALVLYMGWSRWRVFHGRGLMRNRFVMLVLLLFVLTWLYRFFPSSTLVYLPSWAIILQAVVAVVLVVLSVHFASLTPDQEPFVCVWYTITGYAMAVVIAAQFLAVRAVMVRGEVIVLLVIGLIVLSLAVFELRKYLHRRGGHQ